MEMTLSEHWNELLDYAELFYLEWYDMEGVMLGLGYATSLYWLLLMLELAWDALSGKRTSFWEPLANWSFYLLNKAAEATLYGMIIGVTFVLIEDFAITELPINYMTWAICLIACDFSYYWMHRCEHRVRVLWALHSVHHSSEEYDLSTAVRLFWFLDFTLWIFFAPLLIIGFNSLQVLSCMLIVFTYMTWVHTQKIGKLGWFDKYFNSPSTHRVHHGANRQYIDKNYAGILVIWDRMFGSYEPEVEKVRFGLTNPVDSNNPFEIGFHEIISLWNDLRSTDSWAVRFNYLFKGPGWKPGSKTSSANPINSPEAES